MEILHAGVHRQLYEIVLAEKKISYLRVICSIKRSSLIPL